MASILLNALSSISTFFKAFPNLGIMDVNSFKLPIFLFDEFGLKVIEVELVFLDFLCSSFACFSSYCS